MSKSLRLSLMLALVALMALLPAAAGASVPAAKSSRNPWGIMIVRFQKGKTKS